jgi:hypothetical protein
MLHDVIGGVDDHFCITQTICMELPPGGAPIDKRHIRLPMVLLSDEGCKITSPMPYTLFTRIGNSDTPFLPTYHVYLEQAL